MKAVRFHEFGESGVLHEEDVEQPVPGTGEVLVRVASTSFNGVDAGIRGGYLTGPFPVTLPHTPGIDVAGTVDTVGDGVEGVVAGDAVVGFLPMVADGAAAEYVLAPAELLTAAPSSVPLADAAALPLVGLTAWQALFEYGELAASQRLLVNGAGGGVGGYAVQLAKNAGAHVVAVAGPHSIERVTSAGAEQVIDHTAVADVTTEVTEPVDMVLNLAPIDPPALAALLGMVRPGGIVVSTTVYMEAPTDEARGVRGVNVFVRSDAAQLAQLVELVDRGVLRIDIADRVPLAELATVHERSDQGTLPGKTIILVGS